jgi:hypothetical protein
MAITVVTRLKGNQEDGLRIGRQVAPILKNHGATSVRFGYCHSGEYTGQLFGVSIFPDGATYGRAMQALSEDPQMQRLLAEAWKVVELQDRSVIITQDL